MSRALLQWTVRITRSWTYVYTAGLPVDRRNARRADIESDLWELQHDAAAGDGARLPLQVLARLVRGLPDDVLWRVEQGLAEPPRLATLVALTTLAVAAAGLAIAITRMPALPDVPHRSADAWVRPAPPPPPPPPPPPRPGEPADRDYWRPGAR